MISEALLIRATARDGRILRERVLCGFGVRLNARKRTFLVVTSVGCVGSVGGQQFRMMLGYAGTPASCACKILHDAELPV